MNEVVLIGIVSGDVVFSHECKGEKFYNVTLLSRRSSGTGDNIPLLVSERLLHYVSDGEVIEVIGELRSFNFHDNDKNKVVLNVFAEYVNNTIYADENNILISGYICKEPKYRKTPKGREITDIILAVTRKYGKTDYIPCVVWGRNARYSSAFKIGDYINIKGRIQSREYLKNNETKTAYEVSVYNLERVE